MFKALGAKASLLGFGSFWVPPCVAWDKLEPPFWSLLSLSSGQFFFFIVKSPLLDHHAYNWWCLDDLISIILVVNLIGSRKGPPGHACEEWSRFGELRREGSHWMWLVQFHRWSPRFHTKGKLGDITIPLSMSVSWVQMPCVNSRLCVCCHVLFMTDWTLELWATTDPSFPTSRSTPARNFVPATWEVSNKAFLIPLLFLNL